MYVISAVVKRDRHRHTKFRMKNKTVKKKISCEPIMLRICFRSGIHRICGRLVYVYTSKINYFYIKIIISTDSIVCSIVNVQSNLPGDSEFRVWVLSSKAIW